MNTGILSVRYAKALLEYSQETGHADRVFHQVNNLLKHPDKTPDRLEPELERFVALLVRNRRMDALRFILRTYMRMYYDSKGLKAVHLTSAVPSESLEVFKTEFVLIPVKFGCFSFHQLTRHISKDYMLTVFKFFLKFLCICE